MTSMSKPSGSVETLIFVDVDGVLNVGIRDPESKPISFNEANCSVVRKLLQCSEEKDKSDILLSVMRMHTCDGNSSTYGDFLSRNDVDVCDIFVHRLVNIVRTAGDKRKIILSSSWRRPQYSANLKRLEKVIGGYLDTKFMFDDSTAVVDEDGAGSARLHLIGNYISKYCQERKTKDVRVLILDDFFYFPVTGYNCGGTAVDSINDAEKYLAACAPTTTKAKVRIIQTQLSGLLPSGHEVHIGTGLSLQHLEEALSFLRESNGSRRPFEVSARKPVDTYGDLLMPDKISQSFTGGSFNAGFPMSFSAPDDFDDSKQQVSMPTLIFLDIDGVLNIGIKDIGGPLSFNEANFSIARKLFQGTARSDTAEALLAVMRLPTEDGASSTYGDFLSRNDLDVCDVFIHRFVKIMRAAGQSRRVIISSSWRRPQYEKTLRRLEKIIGGYICEPFEFDDCTPLENEVGGHDRLCLIGDYIESFCLGGSVPEMRAIVLDDLFYSPIRQYNCRGILVDSLKAAEQYLEARAPTKTKTKVHILHTQTTCSLPDGSRMDVGTGLSLRHLDDALTFLGGRSRSKEAKSLAVTPQVESCIWSI